MIDISTISYISMYVHISYSRVFNIPIEENLHHYSGITSLRYRIYIQYIGKDVHLYQ